MAAEVLTTSLQQNLITLLCHSDEQGKIVANLIDPNLFEGDYRVIAERAITFWRQHDEAPKLHTPDLVADVLDDPSNRRAKTYTRILHQMAELAGTVNSKYVVQELSAFVRLQKLKSAIVESAEQINKEQHIAIPEIEAIWEKLLRSQQIGFDAGTKLNDLEGLFKYLEAGTTEFRLGIPALDARHIAPMRKALIVLLGAAKRGKSWWLINVGKAAFVDRKRVLHITLEMPEEEVQLRYIQSLFSLTKRQATEAIEVTKFKWKTRAGRDEKEFDGFTTYDVTPDFALTDRKARGKLEKLFAHFGARSANIRIKQFPGRTLTPAMLRGYLDTLEITENFIPDILILDYVKIMKTNDREVRLSIGHNFEDVRAICVERNIAGVTVHQVSKLGAQAALISQYGVAEDWSIIATADGVLVLASTDAEKAHGLARLGVTNWRGEDDSRPPLLLTQSYQIGQFVIDSMVMRSKYFDMLKRYVGDNDEAPEADDG